MGDQQLYGGAPARGPLYGGCLAWTGPSSLGFVSNHSVHPEPCSWLTQETKLGSVGFHGLLSPASAPPTPSNMEGQDGPQLSNPLTPPPTAPHRGWEPQLPYRVPERQRSHMGCPVAVQISLSQQAGQGALDSTALDPYPGSRGEPDGSQAQPPHQEGLDPVTWRRCGSHCCLQQPGAVTLLRRLLLLHPQGLLGHSQSAHVCLHWRNEVLGPGAWRDFRTRDVVGIHQLRPPAPSSCIPGPESPWRRWNGGSGAA